MINFQSFNVVYQGMKRTTYSTLMNLGCTFAWHQIAQWPRSSSNVARNKTWFTFMSCTNASGTERLDIKIIGHAARPRCFVAVLELIMASTTVIRRRPGCGRMFFAWFVKFDRYIGRTKDCKAALLIDNCSAHGTGSTWPVLQNVEIILLLPNTTARLQTLRHRNNCCHQSPVQEKSI